jgi:hypothetical protein
MSTSCLILSDNSVLSESLARALHEKGFRVYIFAEKKSWHSFLKHNHNIKFLDDLNFIPQDTRYLFSISLSPKNYIPQALAVLKSREVKTVFVFSAKLVDLPPKKLLSEVYSLLQSNLVKIFYLGEIVSPEKQLKDNLLSKILNDILYNNIKSYKKNFLLYPLYLNDAVEEIIKAAFTYSNKEPVFLSDSILVKDFVLRIYNFFPIVKNVKISSFSPKTKFVNNLKIHKPKTPIANWIGLLLENSQRQTPRPTVKPKISTLRPTQKRKFFHKKKHLAIAAFTFLWLIFAPFFVLFISSTSLFWAFRELKKGDIPKASFLFSTSRTSTRLGQSLFSVYSQIPLINKKLEFAEETFALISDVSHLGQSIINLSDYSKLFLKGILNKNQYDIKALSQKMGLELEYLYNQSSFIEGKVDKLGITSVDELKKIPLYRKYILAATDITKNLPEILGSDKAKTYMILFQNNMELRPTGGFIGSFALVTFQNGQLIDTSVYDVYSADGQLKGYIKPPSPIVNYLNEETWYLRDSNWDPDFSISSKRAEWFLDKTLDRSVDGVIGLNLDVIQSVLEKTGPLKLVDFADEINSMNIYEKVQHEVEGNFFPGSRKKADYLTSLSSSLIYKMGELNNSQYLDLTKIIFEKLESRDIQVYFHSPAVTRVASVLGWAGEIEPETCGQSCQNGWFGLVEANLGVNKANYYIDREARLEISVSENKINYLLNIGFVNKSTEIYNDTETSYKNYLRLLTPQDAKIQEIKVIKNNLIENISFDQSSENGRLDSGFFLTVPASESRSVIFSWNTPLKLNLKTPGKINLSWWRQSGVKPYPVQIYFDLTKNSQIKVELPNSLTGSGMLGYNTTLSKDLSLKLFW